MNNLTPLEIETMLIHLDQSVKTLTELVNSLMIDKQNTVQKNTPIPPGIGCKFAYDKNGLVLKNMGLEVSDIPKLPIGKIDGLERSLQEMVTTNDLKRLKIDILNNRLNKGDVVESGLKVSIDSNGLVVSTSELLESDIPILSMSHIEGLSDELKLIKSSISSYHSEDTSEASYIVQNGTFPKITFDTQGRVIKGELLSMNDIPNELINKVNEIESLIPTLASKTSVDTINNKLMNKLDINHNGITSGTYTKVIVDANGLITKGDTLSKHDLPELTISDINGLELELKDKVSIDRFTELNNTVSSMISSISKVNDVIKLKSIIGKKANEEDMILLSSKVTNLQSTINNLSNNPNDIIMNILDNINKELSNINGKINTLENKIK